MQIKPTTRQNLAARRKELRQSATMPTADAGISPSEVVAAVAAQMLRLRPPASQDEAHVGGPTADTEGAGTTTSWFIEGGSAARPSSPTRNAHRSSPPYQQGHTPVSETPPWRRGHQCADSYPSATQAAVAPTYSATTAASALRNCGCKKKVQSKQPLERHAPQAPPAQAPPAALLLQLQHSAATTDAQRREAAAARAAASSAEVRAAHADGAAVALRARCDTAEAAAAAAADAAAAAEARAAALELRFAALVEWARREETLRAAAEAVAAGARDAAAAAHAKGNGAAAELDVRRRLYEAALEELRVGAKRCEGVEARWRAAATEAAALREVVERRETEHKELRGRMDSVLSEAKALAQDNTEMKRCLAKSEAEVRAKEQGWVRDEAERERAWAHQQEAIATLQYRLKQAESRAAQERHMRLHAEAQLQRIRAQQQRQFDGAEGGGGSYASETDATQPATPLHAAAAAAAAEVTDGNEYSQMDCAASRAPFTPPPHRPNGGALWSPAQARSAPPPPPIRGGLTSSTPRQSVVAVEIPPSRYPPQLRHDDFNLKSWHSASKAVGARPPPVPLDAAPAEAWWQHVVDSPAHAGRVGSPGGGLGVPLAVPRAG